ncbi:cupin domain-containing protein [Nocardioides marmorisolisilvae]|uniref:Cupin domain-containing protein n=1 Tax=Nocardioides marmorisolisilvae TaxID=1542737 RepID=A0A3N0DZY1_9ACTN|nr:cupin domain-containing protein [Nocardioides marmorisolisilvae]RNL81063.1 cupin domain-containing protein [Nocardioides marmorisolisilvae]
MYVIRGAEAQVFDLPGITFTALAAPSRGSAELCAWLLTVEPGLESPEAHTLDHDEVFLVIDGTVRLAPDGEVAAAGDVVVVPAGEPIQLSNPGGVPARVHVAVTAGFTAAMADGSPVGTPPWAC